MVCKITVTFITDMEINYTMVIHLGSIKIINFGMNTHIKLRIIMTTGILLTIDQNMFMMAIDLI